MLPENEAEPFLGGSDKVIWSKSSLERQNKYYDLSRSKYFSWISTIFSSRYLPLTVFIITSLVWGILLSILLIHISASNLQISGLHESSEAHNFTSHARLLTCGNSTPEAKEKGCRYDILSNHWVPGICMDEEAVAEYQTDGSWFGFRDENRTELLSIEAMSNMEFYYTSERDHIVHCAMLWKKQFRAFYEERPNLDSIIASKHHTDHCSEFLIKMTEKGPDYWKMPIKTWVGYAGCWSKE